MEMTIIEKETRKVYNIFAITESHYHLKDNDGNIKIHNFKYVEDKFEVLLR